MRFLLTHLDLASLLVTWGHSLVLGEQRFNLTQQRFEFLALFGVIPHFLLLSQLVGGCHAGGKGRGFGRRLSRFDPLLDLT